MQINIPVRLLAAALLPAMSAHYFGCENAAMSLWMIGCTSQVMAFLKKICTVYGFPYYYTAPVTSETATHWQRRMRQLKDFQRARVSKPFKKVLI